MARTLTQGRGALGPGWSFPHPSGVNRWWNDPDNTRRAERYLRRLWEEAHQ